MRYYILLIFIALSATSHAATPPQFQNLSTCTLSNNPSNLTSDCANTQAPNIALPDVNIPQTSSFGATYFRITLPTGIDTATAQMVPLYAKAPAWNSDGSRLMLYANNGYFHLLDGNTYTYIERMDATKNFSYSGQDMEPRWSKTDPNIIYYVYGMDLRSYNISTHTGSTIHTFTDAEFGGTPNCSHIHNGDEGNSDTNDRYWAFYCQDAANAHKGVAVYDKQSNSVLAGKLLSAGGVCGDGACPTTFNWVGMSHSGNQVVVNWNADANDGDLTTRGEGTESFDRNLNYLAKISEKNWHCDLAQLADGTDIFVGPSRLSSTNGYRAIRAVSLADGTIKTSCMTPASGLYNHISGRTNPNVLKGWILYSTYDQTGSQKGIIDSGVPLLLESFALNMDTCEVKRIAHTQSNWIGTNYFSEPHASMNFDFTKIVWGSNWRDQAGAVQTYVAELSLSALPGSCGSSNGLALSSAPVSGLCSAGTPSAVSGTGPWSWTCAGSGGGSTASCGATLLEIPSGGASAVVACPVTAGFR